MQTGALATSTKKNEARQQWFEFFTIYLSAGRSALGAIEEEAAGDCRWPYRRHTCVLAGKCLGEPV